ncbi:hypothetical protein NT6N_06950 [Oceaniferula spumae]|uniref:Acyloxyacyl hydrolase n=1 Tax=Oceaniferula spumae TaxID=2979115 RepID=A0AAT9FI86_9BACT
MKLHTITLTSLIAATAIISTSSLHADDSSTAIPYSAVPKDFGWQFDSYGLRAGVDAEDDLQLHTYELFATVNTPYSWKIGDKSRLQLNLEGAVGGLVEDDDSGYYVRFGPQLVLNLGDSPFSLVAASGPAYLSEDVFNNMDLGGKLQFFSSLGVDWKLSDCCTIGYRWHHISNAGIHDKNPGLNMHTLGITWKF